MIVGQSPSALLVSSALSSADKLDPSLLGNSSLNYIHISFVGRCKIQIHYFKFEQCSDFLYVRIMTIDLSKSYMKIP